MLILKFEVFAIVNNQYALILSYGMIFVLVIHFP